MKRVESSEQDQSHEESAGPPCPSHESAGQPCPSHESESVDNCKKVVPVELPSLPESTVVKKVEPAQSSPPPESGVKKVEAVESTVPRKTATKKFESATPNRTPEYAAPLVATPAAPANAALPIEQVQ